MVAIFDTVVFARALINPHSFWDRLVFEHSPAYRLIVSPQIMREVIEVVQCPELVRWFSHRPDMDVARALELLQEAEVVMPEREPPTSRGVKDHTFLAAAEAVKADDLVSEDRDLLDLTKHQGIRTITTPIFLERLSAKRKAA